MQDMTHGRAAGDAENRQLKAEIDARFERGRFVAIEGRLVVADASGFNELVGLLKSQGLDPQRMLIVQAGEEAPTEACILLAAGRA
jgi:hypothetical protein